MLDNFGPFTLLLIYSSLPVTDFRIAGSHQLDKFQYKSKCITVQQEKNKFTSSEEHVHMLVQFPSAL